MSRMRTLLSATGIFRCSNHVFFTAWPRCIYRIQTDGQTPMHQVMKLVSTKKATLESDASPQGIQGDDCEHYRLWLENCQRYRLSNCDEQLKGVVTGRRTLSDVLHEQTRQIEEIADRYKNFRSENDIAKTSVGPYVHVVSPQGIQGDDCAQFKLWMENCQSFKFENIEGSPSGKRTLAQIFSEQDAAIRSIVDKQHRHYSTDAAPKSGEVTLSQRERLKKAVKEYGSTVIVFHVGISLMSLGGFYLAISSGVDVVAILARLGASETILQSSITTGGSTMVVAYAVHKLFAPVRIAITLTCTPFIVRYLRRIGFLKTEKT